MIYKMVFPAEQTAITALDASLSQAENPCAPPGTLPQEGQAARARYNANPAGALAPRGVGVAGCSHGCSRPNPLINSHGIT
jgi:hypothetical protein